MPEPELWYIDQAAVHLGAASNKSASRTLSRWGIKAIDHPVGADGKARARFRADDIRAAKAARPGRGARTDLFPLTAILDGHGHPARWIDSGPSVATKCGKTGVPTATDTTIPLDVPYDYCPDCLPESIKKET